MVYSFLRRKTRDYLRIKTVDYVYTKSAKFSENSAPPRECFQGGVGLTPEF